jgi:type 1 glutamine amidotransferase
MPARHRSLVAGLLTLVSATLLAQQPPATPSATPGRGRGPLGGAQAGFVMAPSFDETPPVLPDDLRSGGVLIFSKTNGYRDEASLRASDAALVAIAATRGWPVFPTDNGAVMNAAQLSKFKLVVWNNTSGDVLTADQRAAFRSWVERGGSYLGIHGAGGDPVVSPGHTSLADWSWYVDTLVGAQFVVHSSIVPGDIHIEDPKSPLTKGLPATWHRAEEWYAFEKSPRATPGVHVLATVDEKSYTPGRATMGADHPLVWWHCVGQGHAVYSALGHAGSMYAEPLMIRLLDNSMGWLLDESGKPCR